MISRGYAGKLLVLAAALLVLAGCRPKATSVRPPEELRLLASQARWGVGETRERALGRMLGHLKPGMTRREVREWIGQGGPAVSEGFIGGKCEDGFVPYYCRLPGSTRTQVMTLHYSYDRKRRDSVFREVRGPHPSGGPRLTAVPAQCVNFWSVAPDQNKRRGRGWLAASEKGKRGGLHAMAMPFARDKARYKDMPSPMFHYRRAVQGRADKPRARWPVILAGKLPGTVSEKDLFLPESGKIKGGEIEIPVRYVRYTGPVDRELANRSVYFIVYLPLMLPGKYRVTVRFVDYSYAGNLRKLNPAEGASRLKPLVREFEVVKAITFLEIPAGETRVYLRPVDKEKRSGLYAVRPAHLRAPILWSERVAGVFSAAADGKRRPLVADDHVVLVGKLPGTVSGVDFFRAEDGRVKGNKIDIPIKFVRYAGPSRGRPASRAAYLVAQLPRLPAGKYRAVVVFKDYVYRGNKYKIARPMSSEPPLPRFKRLTCEFEVKPAAGEKAAAKKISWGMAVKGLRVGLSPAGVTLEHGAKSFGVRVWYENIGGKPVQVPDHRGGRVVNAFRIMFAGDKAGKPFYACFAFERCKTVTPRPRTLKPGERFSEEFRLPDSLGAGARSRLPRLLPGESFTLRVGLCAKLDPMGPKDWQAATTLKSGAVTVTRAP
jgi:hypothetical protein